MGLEWLKKLFNKKQDEIDISKIPLEELPAESLFIEHNTVVIDNVTEKPLQSPIKSYTIRSDNNGKEKTLR